VQSPRATHLVADSGPADRLAHAHFGDGRGELPGTVVAAAVGVKDRVGNERRPVCCLGQRFDDQWSLVVVVHGVADDHLRVTVDDRCQI
jgi:hypothetical protein